MAIAFRGSVSSSFAAGESGGGGQVSIVLNGSSWTFSRFHAANESRHRAVDNVY